MSLQSWLGMHFYRIGLAEGFPRITQKYRQPSTRLEEFWALVLRAEISPPDVIVTTHHYCYCYY